MMLDVKLQLKLLRSAALGHNELALVGENEA
jgi:hypothetical protein